MLLPTVRYCSLCRMRSPYHPIQRICYCHHEKARVLLLAWVWKAYPIQPKFALAIMSVKGRFVPLSKKTILPMWVALKNARKPEQVAAVSGERGQIHSRKKRRERGRK